MAKRSKKRKAAIEKISTPVSGPVVQPVVNEEVARSRARGWILGLSLMLMVFLVYQPAWRAGLAWDDEAVITQNPVIAGPYGVKEIWTTSAADICPLTLTTFWAEYKLWRSNPRPFHVINILLHGVSAVLLWQVLRRLRIPGAWWGAALWALHPVAVESVAWITEMKNTQSAVFFLLSIFFWVRKSNAGEPRQRGGRKGNYFLTLVFAAMAMASKSSTVILPLVLCLCSWWLEGRWKWSNLVKVVPFFVLSILAGLVTIWTQNELVASLPDARWDRSWLERLATAGDAVWFYLEKLLWPYPLMTIYPRWKFDDGEVIGYLPVLGAVVALVIFWIGRNSWARPWFFAYAFFLVALLPVMGLLNNTFFRFSFVADHFQYLASMAPLALAGAGITCLGEVRWQAVLGAATLSLLGILSWQQAWIYKDQQTLWNYTLKYNPDCWLAQNGLGVWLVAQGKSDEAILHYEEALRLNPNYMDGHYNLGVALTNVGRLDDAMAAYRAVLAFNPDFAKARRNVGYLLGQAGKTDEAIAEFERTIQSDPGYAEAYYNLGVALFSKGRKDEAVESLKKAVLLKPDYVGANSSLGVALAQMNRTDEAIAQFKKILELNSHDADAHNNLGIAYTMQHRDDEAIAEYQASLKIKPNNTAHDNLGALLIQRGQVRAAAAEFEAALELNPADKIAQNNLAEAQRRMKQGEKGK